MHDVIIQTIFYVFAALAVGSALMVISQNNPVRCVLFLVVTFFASAGVWLLAEAEFLALILILVYVGAVMTLFLFVVMMLNVDAESSKSQLIYSLPFGLIIVALLTSLLVTAIPNGFFKEAVQQGSYGQNPTAANAQATLAHPSNTEQLGLVLYTDYLLAFELAAVLLLIAIISAITLAHRNTIRSRKQDIKEQIMTRKEDRIQLVTMIAEK